MAASPVNQGVREPTAVGSAERGEATDVARLRRHLLEELDSVALYEALAALEHDNSAYFQLAAATRERAESLGARLRSAGVGVPRIRIPRRMRLFAKLMRLLSGGFAVPIFTSRAVGARDGSDRTKR